MASTTTDAPALPRASLIKRGVVKKEFGASGTPNYGGYISGVDYNPKVDGKRAIRVFDEMRNDGQCQGILLVSKLPVQRATWEVQPPANADNTDKAIAAFCQDVLFGESWPFVLSHLLLKLEFGVSVLEKVWILGDDGRLRFESLEPRLPQTIERWIINEKEQLTGIEQYAQRGDGGYHTMTIPADYAVVSVHNREGKNWWGRSLLRPAYIHWFMKNALYRIDVTKQDRYGIGIPEGVIDDSNPDQSYSTDELAAIDQMLAGFRADEASYIRHYKSLEVKILTPQGNLSNDALINSVEHHNAMIARSVIAGHLSQGEQRHGSFGLGDRLADSFVSMVETIAKDTGGDVNRQLVKPLCDANFPMQGRKYPSAVASGVSDIDVKELTAALRDLGQNYITPDDSIEDVLRKWMRLPPMQETDRGRSRVVVPSPFEPKDPADPALPGAKKKPRKANDDKDRPAKPTLVSAKKRALRLSAHVDAVSGRIYGRAPTEFEEAVFALRDIPQALDLYTQGLVDRLTEIRRGQLTAIVDEVIRKDARETGVFTDIRPDEIALPDVAELERAIKEMQRRVFAYGVEQVREEALRQGVALARGAVDVFMLDAGASANRRAAKSAMVTSAKVTAEKMGDAWYARILETMIRERRTGLQGDELRAAVVDVLDEEAETGVKRDATAEVNEAFGLGRATEASAHKDLIDVVIYSALLDGNTCKVCEDLDGEEMAFGSERYFETMPPNKDCEGNRGSPDACRCAHLFKFAGAK